jgi:hypothetical protein
MHSTLIHISQKQLESTHPKNLLRLAKYLKLKAFYNYEHIQLAFIISMVLSDQFN